MPFFLVNVLGSADLRSHWQEVTICLLLLDDQKGGFLALLLQENAKGTKNIVLLAASALAVSHLTLKLCPK